MVDVELALGCEERPDSPSVPACGPILTAFPAPNRALVNLEPTGELALREPAETPREGEPSREIGGGFGVRDGDGDGQEFEGLAVRSLEGVMQLLGVGPG